MVPLEAFSTKRYAPHRHSVAHWSHSLPINERRRMLALVIVRCDGVLRLAAYEVGAHRTVFYRWLHRYGLWPVVTAARKARLRNRRQREIEGRVIGWRTGRSR